MSKVYVPFNPYAGNGRGEEDARTISVHLPDEELTFCDMTKISSYADFFAGVNPTDRVVLCGGDGTLNRFVNAIEGVMLPTSIEYYAVGSGNDFMHDLGREKGSAPVDITNYLRDLPTVTVNGKTSRFINGVGYGIDGYCCEVGDKLRASSTKKINYTSIAIKGLLFHYKPKNATVIVDGVRHTYSHVWLAPTMNGRFYGGGMMIAPSQNRLNEEKTLSVVVLSGSGKLKTLMVFPSIFEGKHVEHTDIVEVLTGHEITVEFDRPNALQIDGETILNVTSYTAKSAAPAPVKESEELCASVS